MMTKKYKTMKEKTTKPAGKDYAGSLVTKDVPANMVVAGSPAKVIRPIDPER